MSSGDWQIHHDTSPAHSSQLKQYFLAKHEIAQVRQISCSPQLAQRGSVLFPKIKLDLKRWRLDDVDIIKRNMTQQLVTKSKTDFHKCSEQRKNDIIIPLWPDALKKSASGHKGIILTGISPPLLQDYYYNNYKQSLDAFWTTV
jgi:hypothetical protein